MALPILLYQIEVLSLSPFFWDEFCGTLGIRLKLSTAYHPETDGQTEIVNQHINMRLRPFMSHYQDNWSELLPLIDFAAATLTSEYIKTSSTPKILNEDKLIATGDLLISRSETLFGCL